MSKKFLFELMICSLCFMLPGIAMAAGNQWAWMSGSDIRSQVGVYGTQGVADTANVPGSREGSVSWTDSDGNLWLFGGIGLNDLWLYDLETHKWTWMSGSNISNQTSVYGTQGVADAANVPGARDGSVSWADSDGNLWLFGGSDFFSGSLNELWTYDPAANMWTWVSGSNTGGQRGVYGTQGVADEANVPGGRSESVSWTDSADNLWLFGGLGYGGTETSGGQMHDLWRYEPSSNMWTWMSGSSVGNLQGIYGTKGVANANNIPGGREGSISWTDSSDNLWLFGGNGEDKDGNWGPLNDLWVYDSLSNMWTWVSGSNIRNQSGVYGTMGVPDAGNIPGARDGNISWTDSSGNLWLFGGDGYDSNGDTGRLNDLWRYDSNTGEWTWLRGSATIDQSGTYNTIGVPAASNIPGARDGSISWTDSSDNLWLFGGYGYDSNVYSGRLNDLWRYELPECEVDSDCPAGDTCLDGNCEVVFNGGTCLLNYFVPFNNDRIISTDENSKTLIAAAELLVSINDFAYCPEMTMQQVLDTCVDDCCYIECDEGGTSACIGIDGKNCYDTLCGPWDVVCSCQDNSDCSAGNECVDGSCEIIDSELPSCDGDANYDYTISEGAVTITGYNGSGGDIVIPATIECLPVTVIDSNAFYGETSLTSVTFPDSPTSTIAIGASAFRGCSNLTSVSFTDGLKNFQGLAFRDCEKLTSVSIPASILWMGKGVFSNCANLTSIQVGEANVSYTSVDGILYSKDGTRLMQYPGGLPASSFTIPDTVTEIDTYSFGGCSYLESIAIPAGITSIEGWVFNSCSKLSSVTIPDSVTSIGSNAFSQCGDLTSIVIPDSVTNIEGKAFNSCGDLVDAIFLGNAPSMEAEVFDYSAFGFSICYTADATGFDSPTWYGYPAADCACSYDTDCTAGNMCLDGSCEIDIDFDGIINAEDNCPSVSNANQEDIDGNDVGDICDAGTVYGYIKDTEGAAIEDVTVEIVRVSCGNEISVEASTNASGYYAYGGLESGYTYGVVAHKELYSFAPVLGTWGNVTIPQTEIRSHDFTATVIPAP